MTRIAVYRLAAGLGLAAALGAAASAQTDRSVWQGTYTSAQADRGEAVFGVSCTRCHAVEDFTGATFLGTWEGSTALDLFRLLQGSMPQENPGSLAPQEYADVVAYLFRGNGFPAGQEELTPDAERLKLVRIEPKQ